MSSGHGTWTVTVSGNSVNFRYCARRERCARWRARPHTDQGVLSRVQPVHAIQYNTIQFFASHVTSATLTAARRPDIHRVPHGPPTAHSEPHTGTLDSALGITLRGHSGRTKPHRGERERRTHTHEERATPSSAAHAGCATATSGYACNTQPGRSSRQPSGSKAWVGLAYCHQPFPQVRS